MKQIKNESIEKLVEEYKKEIESFIIPSLENGVLSKDYFVGRYDMIRKIIIDLEELLT